MRILVDETVIAEYVGERQPYCACWNKLNALEMVGYAELWALPNAYRVMANALGEALPSSEVNPALAATLDYVRICSIDGGDVLRALESEQGFDDALLDACVRKIKADYVVTRRADVKLSASSVPVLTPEGLFSHLEESEGLTFELVDF